MARSLLLVLISLSLSANAGIVRGHFTKKGKWVNAHYRKSFNIKKPRLKKVRVRK